jgi:5-methylcytosine-specific restriction protein A
MHKLTKGQIIDNTKICEIFCCSPQGGMRRSHRTNTLVIVMNHIKSVYIDKWIGNILYYTGMGTEGDQSFEFMQNKTLFESNENHVKVLLFEVLRNNEYTFVGRVELVEKPYFSNQIDKNGKNRKVCIFPLKIVEEEYEFELIKN